MKALYKMIKLFHNKFKVLESTIEGLAKATFKDLQAMKPEQMDTMQT